MAEKETGAAFALSLQGGAEAQKKQVEAVLSCNEKTSANGLALTAEQAQRLVEVRREALRKPDASSLAGEYWTG